MNATFVALLIAFPLAGLLIRKRWAIVLPFIGWPLYYVGLNRGWWGCCGTGDGWQALAILLAVLGAGTTALAIGLGRVATGS
jgi:hypothetical protein